MRRYPDVGELSANDSAILSRWLLGQLCCIHIEIRGFKKPEQLYYSDLK